MRVPFGLQSARSESTPLSAQRMLNCYLQEAPQGAKVPVAVPRAAGISPFAVAAGVPRGACKWQEKLYVVHGTRLYRVNPDASVDDIGGLPGVGRVWMSASKTQLAISNGSTMFVWNGTTLAQVTDTDFPGSSWIVGLDGYTIFGFPNLGEFGVTAINDATDYDAFDFAEPEAAPDKTIGGLVDHRDLFLGGTDSIEVWRNVGDPDFPFARSGSGYIEVGIAGPHAMTKKANSVYFLGSDGVAYTLNGYNPQRVSTHEIEHLFAQQDKSKCVCEAWTERGHAFVSYRFPNACAVLDVGTQLWHERQSYGKQGWSIGYVVDCYGKTFIGADDKVGELKPETFAEFSGPQVITCTSAAISNGGQWVDHNRLELIFETGVGLPTGQGSAPLVMLRWSDDGGRTWSNQRTASLGAIGKTKARAIFTRMARSRDRVYEWSVSDPVKLWFCEARLNEAA